MDMCYSLVMQSPISKTCACLCDETHQEMEQTEITSEVKAGERTEELSVARFSDSQMEAVFDEPEVATRQLTMLDFSSQLSLRVSLPAICESRIMYDFTVLLAQS